MTSNPTPTETFAVEDGYLVRRAIPRRGQPYEHRCPLAEFEQISHAAEEQGDRCFAITDIVEYERAAGRYVAFTNVALTLAFLRERGILDTRHRKSYAATSSVHLDAMTEYHALAAHA